MQHQRAWQLTQPPCWRIPGRKKRQRGLVESQKKLLMAVMLLLTLAIARRMCTRKNCLSWSVWSQVSIISKTFGKYRPCFSRVCTISRIDLMRLLVQRLQMIGKSSRYTYISDFSLFINFLLQALKDLRLQQSLCASWHDGDGVWCDGSRGVWSLFLVGKMCGEQSFDYIITVTRATKIEEYSWKKMKLSLTHAKHLGKLCSILMQFACFVQCQRIT